MRRGHVRSGVQLRCLGIGQDGMYMLRVKKVVEGMEEDSVSDRMVRS